MLNSFFLDKSNPTPVLNRHLSHTANPLNLYQKDMLTAQETALTQQMYLHTLIDKLDGRKVKGVSDKQKLINDAIEEANQEKFRNTVLTMGKSMEEINQVRAKQGAALTELAFSNFPTDMQSLMGSTLQGVKNLINSFDIGIQNLDPLDASLEAKKQDYNRFVSSTVYRYLFEPSNGEQDFEPINNNITKQWRGLITRDNLLSRSTDVTASELRGIEIRETWLKGRISVSENLNVERVRRIHTDIQALSLEFNPYTSEAQVQEVRNRQELGDRLLRSANNVLNKNDYMSKIGIEPMVNLIYSARTELTIDAFQLQNAAIVEVLIDKLRNEKERIKTGEFKFNLRLAYPSQDPSDLTGMRILGPNLVVLERLRDLKEEMASTMTESEIEGLERSFGINYTTANYHTKIYTSDSYAMLGSFNATSPVGNSIRMAGSNYEEVFIFRNYGTTALKDSKGNYLRDKQGNFIYDDTEENEYIPHLRTEQPSSYKSAHTKLYRQTRAMQDNPERYAAFDITGKSQAQSKLDRFSAVGGALHAGNALRDAINLTKMDSDNKLFMNLNQVWLLQYTDNLFTGKGKTQSSFSEFGTDLYSQGVEQSDKVKEYRGLQDTLFNLLIENRAQITVDTHTYEDKVLKPLMSEISSLLDNSNRSFYKDFDGDLGAIGKLNRAQQAEFGSVLGAIGSKERKLQALAFNLFGDSLDSSAALDILNNNVYRGSGTAEENLSRLRVIKQLAAITSGNISFTTQTMQHVKNLAVFNFGGDNAQGKMLMGQSGSSNYGLSSLDFSNRDGEEFNPLRGGFMLDGKTSYEVSYATYSEEAIDKLGYGADFKEIRERHSQLITNKEEDELMLQERENNYRREWKTLANRDLSKNNNMLHTTKATWESQVKSAKLNALAEQIETINKALGYKDGEGIQITKTYTQGKDTAKLLSLNIKLNTGLLTGARTANSTLSFRVTAFEDFIYLVNQNKLIGKSLFVNETNDDIFMPYGKDTQSKRLGAKKTTELSDVDTFTNLIVSMAAEMSYRTLVTAPQEYIAKLSRMGQLDSAAARMLESMALGRATANSEDAIANLDAYGLKKLEDVFTAKFGLVEGIQADTPILRARQLLRQGDASRESVDQFLQAALQDIRELKNQTIDQRKETIGKISLMLANAAKSNAGQDYEAGVAYAILETHNDFLHQLKIDKDLKALKTTFFEPYIARQQGSFYANSQTYYRRQIYGVRASNARMAQAMNLSMNSEEVAGNIGSYWGYARATGYAFGASEDIGGPLSLIRGVAEGGGGRESIRDTGMSMFGQKQISVADVTDIRLAEESLVAQYISKSEYVSYVEELANLFDNSSSAEKTKQYLQSDEYLSKVFKQDDAVILFTFNVPKKKSQIPQRLKNVIGSKPMFELSSELSYLLNKGDDNLLLEDNRAERGVNGYMDKLVDQKTAQLMLSYAKNSGLDIKDRDIERYMSGLPMAKDKSEKLEGFHKKALNALDPYFSIGMYNDGHLREMMTPDKVRDIEMLKEELQDEHGFTDEDFKEAAGIARYMLITRLKASDALITGRKGYTEGKRVDGKKSLVIVQLTGAYTDYFYSNPFYGVDSGVLFGGKEDNTDLRKQVYANPNDLYGRFYTQVDALGQALDGDLNVLNRINSISEASRAKNAVEHITTLIKEGTKLETYNKATLQTAAAVEKLLKLRYGNDKYEANKVNQDIVRDVLTELASNPLLGLTSNERAALKSMSAVFERVEKRHKASMLSTDWVNASGLFLAKRGDIVEFDRHRNKIIVYHQSEESGRNKSEYIVGTDIGLTELSTVVGMSQGTSQEGKEYIDNIKAYADSRKQVGMLLGVGDNITTADDNRIKSTQTIAAWVRPAEDSKQVTIRAEQLSGYNPENQLIWEMAFLRAITPSSGRRNEASSGLFKGVEQVTSENTLFDLAGAGRRLTYIEYIQLQMVRQMSGNSSLTIDELNNGLDWAGRENYQQRAGVWGQDVARLNRIKGVVNPSNLKSYMYEHGIHIVKEKSLRSALIEGGIRDNDGSNKGFLAASLLMAFGESKDKAGNSMLMTLDPRQKAEIYRNLYANSIKDEYGAWFKGLAFQATIKGLDSFNREIKAITEAFAENKVTNEILTKYDLERDKLERAIQDKTSREYGELRDTILGKQLLSEGKAHFSSIQNVSLGMMGDAIYSAITGKEGGDLKQMLTAFLNSVENHKDKALGQVVKYNQATTDMATVAAAIDMVNQLSMYSTIDTPTDLNLTDQSTVLKLASIMGMKAADLANAMKPDEKEQWAGIQSMISAITRANKMIQLYTSTQFSFSKEGIGRKGTGSLEFQHLLDPLYQLEENFYKTGSVATARKVLATLYSNMSVGATPSIAHGMIEDSRVFDFASFGSPFSSANMLGLYSSYTDIDNTYRRETQRLFREYELGRSRELLDTDGKPVTKEGKIQRERYGLKHTDFITQLATDIVSTNTNNAELNAAYYKLITAGPQSLENRHIEVLEDFVSKNIKGDKLDQYTTSLLTIRELKEAYTGLQYTLAYEQMNVPKAFGPEVVEQFLQNYNVGRGIVMNLSGWNLSANDETGDLFLTINKAESIASYLPSSAEIKLLGAQYETFVGEIVTKTLDVVQAFTPGTKMYELRMKMATMSEGANLSITQEEAAMLKQFYESATSMFSAISEAAAEGITQKAQGAKNSFMGAVTTASGSFLVPQRYAVLANEAMRAAENSNVYIRERFLSNILNNLENVGEAIPTSIGDPLPASNTSKPNDYSLDKQAFNSSLQSILKSGVSLKFNNLFMAIDKLDFNQIVSKTELDILKANIAGINNKVEQKFLTQLINLKQDMYTHTDNTFYQRIQQDLRAAFGMQLAGTEKRTAMDIFADLPVIWASHKNIAEVGLTKDKLQNLTYAKEQEAYENMVKQKLNNYAKDLANERTNYLEDGHNVVGEGQRKLDRNVSKALEQTKYVKNIDALIGLMEHLESIMTNADRVGNVDGLDRKLSFEEQKQNYSNQLESLTNDIKLKEQQLKMWQVRLEDDSKYYATFAIKTGNEEKYKLVINDLQQELSELRNQTNDLKQSALGEAIKASNQYQRKERDKEKKLANINNKYEQIDNLRDKLSKLDQTLTNLPHNKRVIGYRNNVLSQLDAVIRQVPESKRDKFRELAINGTKEQLNAEKEREIQKVNKAIQQAWETAERHKNKLTDWFVIDRNSDQFKDIRKYLIEVTGDPNINLDKYLVIGQDGNAHIDLRGIMAIANMASNAGDSRQIMEVMAFRSSPIGGTAAANQMYKVIQGIGTLNQIAQDLQEQDSEKRQFIQLSQERSKALSLLNPLGIVTSNLGDWDGDPYTFIFASASNLANRILELDDEIAKYQQMYGAIGNDQADKKKIQNSVGGTLESLRKERALVQDKLNSINDKLQNQDKAIRKDIAKYLGLDMRYFDSVENGGWAKEHIATDIMFTYIEQGRGLFGGLEEQALKTKDLQNNLTNLFSKDSFGSLYMELNAPWNNLAGVEPADAIQQHLDRQLTNLSNELINAPDKIDNLSAVEKYLIELPKGNELRNEFLQHLAINAVKAMQGVNMSEETYETFTARLFTSMNIDENALAAVNKLIGQGSGTDVTETGFSVMNRVMGKAGSDILGKTYNTLVGALYSSAPELAMATVFESKEFRNKMSSVTDENKQALLSTEELDRTMEILSKAREQNSSTLGFIKNINQLLRDGIKPKTPGGDSKDMMDELEQDMANMRNADPESRLAMLQKINMAAENLGPGQGIGLKALTQLNSLINATDGIFSEVELEQSVIEGANPDTSKRLSVLFGIDTTADDPFNRVLDDYRTRLQTEQVSIKSAAALKTSLDLRALVTQYRFSFINKTAEQDAYSNVDTLFNKFAEDRILPVSMKEDDRRSFVDANVELFFKDPRNMYVLSQSLSQSEFKDISTPKADPAAESERLAKLRTYYSLINEVNNDTKTFMGDDGENLLRYASAEKLRQTTVANMRNPNAGDSILSGEPGQLMEGLSNLALGGKMTPDSLISMVESLVADANVLLDKDGKVTSLDVLIANLENSVPGFTSLSNEDRKTVVNTLRTIASNKELSSTFNTMMQASANDLKAQAQAQMIEAFNADGKSFGGMLPITKDMEELIRLQQLSNQFNSSNKVNGYVNEAIVTNYNRQVRDAKLSAQSAAMELLGGLGLAALGVLTQEGTMEEEELRSIIGGALTTYAYMRPTMGMMNRVGDRSLGTARSAKAKLAGSFGSLFTGGAGWTSGKLMNKSVTDAMIYGDEEAVGQAALREVVAVSSTTVISGVLNTDIRQVAATGINNAAMKLVSGEKLNVVDKTKLNFYKGAQAVTSFFDKMNPVPVSPISYDDTALGRAVGDSIKGAFTSAIIGVMIGRAMGGARTNYRAIYNERLDAVLANSEQALSNSVESQVKAGQERVISQSILTGETGEQVAMSYDVIEEYDMSTEIDRIRYDGWSAEEFLSMYG